VVAHGATDIVEGATQVSTLDEGLAGCVRAFATSRRSGKRRGQSLELHAAALESTATRARVAWVFGPESNGLTADEVDRCSARVRIPTAPQHPSLNLAQAVALVAYELYLAGRPGPDAPVAREASLEDRHALYEHLEDALLAIGFLRLDTARARMGELRRLLERSHPSPSEVRYLRGMARRMARAGNPTRPGAQKRGRGGESGE
jgi:TrmH family RNA methyltransferase